MHSIVCHRVVMLCRAIKQIASGFNLTNELTVSLQGLVVESKQLKSAQARESADRAIEELKAFISQLSEEAPGAIYMSLLNTFSTAVMYLQMFAALPHPMVTSQ